MRLLTLVTAAAVLLWSGTLWAQTLVGASCTGARPGACLTFLNTETTDTAINLPRGSTYYAVFDPDTGSTGTATATVRIYGPCADDAASLNTCEKMNVDADVLGGLNDVNLDGHAGEATTVNTRTRFGIVGGLYFIDIVVGPGVGETAVLNFEQQEGRP